MDIRLLNDLPWIVVGDFNLLRTRDETNGTNFNLGLAMEFNHCLDELKLTEVTLRNRKYTYSNKRFKPTLSKLDRVFFSEDWNQLNNGNLKFELADVTAPVSDHIPIKLSIKKMDRQRTRTFKFEQYWLRYKETREIIKKA
jgi:endonuclease/exonuclease/phosphatase family metal-dependent hydrolase